MYAFFFYTILKVIFDPARFEQIIWQLPTAKTSSVSSQSIPVYSKDTLLIFFFFFLHILVHQDLKSLYELYNQTVLCQFEPT